MAGPSFQGRGVFAGVALGGLAGAPALIHDSGSDAYTGTYIINKAPRPADSVWYSDGNNVWVRAPKLIAPRGYASL